MYFIEEIRKEEKLEYINGYQIKVNVKRYNEIYLGILYYAIFHCLILNYSISTGYTDQCININLLNTSFEFVQLHCRFSWRLPQKRSNKAEKSKVSKKK